MHIILAGGGLDSTVMALTMPTIYPSEPTTLLHFDYGQKAAASELHSLFRLRNYMMRNHIYEVNIATLTLDMSYSKSGIMRSSVLDTSKRLNNRLELRNPTLIMYAASYATSLYDRSTIYVGFHKEPRDKPFPDADAAYLNSMNSLIYDTTGRDSNYKKLSCVVSAPLSHMTRQDIFDIGQKLTGNITSLIHSCYEEVPCGRCTHCNELAAMEANYLERHPCPSSSIQAHA